MVHATFGAVDPFFNIELMGVAVLIGYALDALIFSADRRAAFITDLVAVGT